MDKFVEVHAYNLTDKDANSYASVDCAVDGCDKSAEYAFLVPANSRDFSAKFQVNAMFPDWVFIVLKGERPVAICPQCAQKFLNVVIVRGGVLGEV